MDFRVRLSLSLGLMLLCAGSAHALVIDNFEDGAFSFSTSSYNTEVSASPSDVIGGARHLKAPPSNPASLTLTGGDDAAVFSVSSTVTVKYDGSYDGSENSGALNLDLSAFNRIVVTVTSASPTNGTNLTVFVNDGVNPTSNYTQTLAGAGTYTFLFSSFSNPAILDNTAAFVGLVLQQSMFESGTYSISHIEALPEPAALVLLLPGLLALRLGERKVQCAS